MRWLRRGFGDYIYSFSIIWRLGCAFGIKKNTSMLHVQYSQMSSTATCNHQTRRAVQHDCAKDTKQGPLTDTTVTSGYQALRQNTSMTRYSGSLTKTQLLHSS
jgi:hypothetical protein